MTTAGEEGVIGEFQLEEFGGEKKEQKQQERETPEATAAIEERCVHPFAIRGHHLG